MRGAWLAKRRRRSVSQMHFSELSKSLNCIAKHNVKLKWGQSDRERERQRGSVSEKAQFEAHYPMAQTPARCIQKTKVKLGLLRREKTKSEAKCSAATATRQRCCWQRLFIL